MNCSLFRAHKSEQVAPLHGANAFTWQLTIAQDAIMGSIAFHDPHPALVVDVFIPLRQLFEDDIEFFVDEMFLLRALGLVWIDCQSDQMGYTQEGREHIQVELESIGTSLQKLRLDAQKDAPSVALVPCYERLEEFFFEREMKSISVTGKLAVVETIQ